MELELIIGLIFLAATLTFAFLYSRRRNRRHLEQLRLMADHFGHKVVKKPYKKGFLVPKVHQVIGQLDGYDSKLYGYVVSAGNTYIQMTAFEMEIPFLKDLTLVIGKENVFTKALKNIAGEGFVTRDEAFDDTFKIKTNKSLLLKQVFLNESFREALMNAEKLLKGRFIIKGNKLRYEEAYSIEKEKHRIKSQEIIELSRLIVGELKLHLDLTDNEGERIALPENEEAREEIIREIRNEDEIH